jgi:glycosidase
MEAGDTTESGAPALFERLPIFWGIAERRPEFLRFYRQAIALRRAYRALITGDTIWLRNSDESRIVTFARRGATEEILVAINLSNRPFTGDVEAANGARFTDITPTADSKSDQVASSNDAALVRLTLGAWGFRFLRRAL